jgi:hypothetical protein
VNAAAAVALLGAWLTASTAAADDEATAPDVPPGAPGNEIDLAPGGSSAELLWGPNRFGFGMAMGLTLWKQGRFDEPRSLWDEQGGDALISLSFDYHRMFGDWIGLGGSVLFPTTTDAQFFTGLGVAIGPRVYLWPDWVYLQVEAVASYPPVIGAIGTIGVSIPLFGGARLRLENQFWLNILGDDADFTFAWFPGFAAELGF